MNSFGPGTRRRRRIDQRPYAPFFNSALQFIVIATNEFNLISWTAGHLRDLMRVQSGRVDQNPRFDRAGIGVDDVMRRRYIDSDDLALV